MATSVAMPAGAVRQASRKKTVKGVIALGAAALLLSGGAGTYALWSDTVDLNGGDINSGQLKFTGTTTGAWTDISGGATTAIADISTFRVVPGDVLRYSLQTTILAEGDNLEATLAADPTTVTGDPQLLADMDVITAVTINNTAVSAITSANNGDTVDVAVTFTFDEASTNATQLQSLDLSALELRLDQDAR